MKFRPRSFLTAWIVLGLAACGGGSSSSSNGMPPPASSVVRVRFAEAAPSLETLINGLPQPIGAAYLRVNGQTVSSQFNYGSITSFLNMAPGTKSMSALNVLGYRVGPFKSSPLTGGKDYTLALVGNYPNYRVLTFEEPAGSKTGTQLSLYEASPAAPNADFGYLYGVESIELPETRQRDTRASHHGLAGCARHERRGLCGPRHQALHLRQLEQSLRRRDAGDRQRL